jgi:hypothetical protein
MLEHDDHDGDARGAETGAEGPAPQGAMSAVPSAAPPSISRSRLAGANVVIGVATLLLIVGIFATWANRLLFSPDNWAKTSTELLQNPNVRATTANYLVDQLYTNVDVAGLLKSGLPPQLQPLAAPAAGALRNAAVQGTELALTRPVVQNLWAQSNRAADHVFIAIVNGGKGSVGVNQGAVTLDLGAMLDNVAARLGLPSNLSSKLPPNIANLTVFKSDQLKYVQNWGNAIRNLAVWLVILVPILYALALFLAAGHRRRTLMTIGFSGVFAGVLVLLGRSILESQIAASLTSDASLQITIRQVYVIASSILADVAGAVIVGGVALVIAAWFAGPARIARTSREAMAPFLRERPVASYAITVGVMALIFIWNPLPATGKPAGIIVFTLLALLGTWILIRQTAQEFPDARPGAATQAIQSRWRSVRGRRRPADVAASQASITPAEQLRQLADLREHGELTNDEYQSAKEQLLHH